MSDLGSIISKQGAFDYLDNYAAEQRIAVKKQQLRDDTGIIKSYMLETEAHDEIDVENLFRKRSWRMKQLEENFYSFNISGQDYGFIERTSSRHIAIHTIQKSETADRFVQEAVRMTSKLDFVWLSGHYLN